MSLYPGSTVKTADSAVIVRTRYVLVLFHMTSRAAMFEFQTSPVGVELFSYVKAFF